MDTHSKLQALWHLEPGVRRSSLAHCPSLGPWINYVPCWALWALVEVQVGALPGRQAKEAACSGKTGREDWEGGVHSVCWSLPTSVINYVGQRRLGSTLSLSPKQERGRVIRRKKRKCLSPTLIMNSLVLYIYHMFLDERKSFKIVIHLHSWPLGSILPGCFCCLFVCFPGGTRNEQEMESKKSRMVETSVSFVPVPYLPLSFHISFPFYLFLSE